MQKRLQNKARRPVQLAADVVERALMTGGSTYLATRESKLLWWQLLLMDVQLLLAVVVFLAVGIFAFVGWGTLALLYKVLRSASKGVSTVFKFNKPKAS